jgi:hypothetical protein
MAEPVTKVGSSGNAMLILGGVGAIIWLVGAIMSVFLAGVGSIVLGVGLLLASFAAIGLWQKTKAITAIFTFIMALIGGVLFLVGGVLLVAGIGVGAIVAFVGQVLFGISLITLALIINKLGPQLNTQAKLGMDLVFPAVATSMAGGCAALGAVVTVTIPAAVFLMILFFVAK